MLNWCQFAASIFANSNQHIFFQNFTLLFLAETLSNPGSKGLGILAESLVFLSKFW